VSPSELDVPRVSCKLDVKILPCAPLAVRPGPSDITPAELDMLENFLFW
jgi:hypothetical protein